MQRKIETFLNSHHLQDPDDIDGLIELASLLRDAMEEKRYPEICTLIRYTVEHEYDEAFSWCMGILQEELEKEDCALTGFDCAIGRFIPGYDRFIQRLQVDLKVCQSDTETVYDQHGEAESIFQILVYETAYPNIRLVSSENFDTRDNDYVQYRLSFVKKSVI